MWMFLNPYFLWAVAAVAVPLLLHLMQRRRSVRIRFSTLRFLKLAQRRSSSRIRMENFLLWLLRTLILLSLALAFALPVVRLKGLGSLMGKAHRDVALVLDASYSMGYESAQRSVWEAAKSVAVAVVESLQKGDRVSLFLADDDVTPLIEQPTGDLEMALALIRAQRVRMTTSQLLPAVRAAAAVKSARQERELHVISDGQALPWRSFAESAGQSAGLAPSNAAQRTPPAPTGQTTAGKIADMVRRDVGVFVTLVGSPTPQNSYPLDITVEPPLLRAETPATLTAKIGHTGPAQTLAVALHIDGREVSSCTVETRDEAVSEVEIAIPPLSPGVHPARLALPADSLGIDDGFHFLLRSRDEFQVLCVGTAEDTFYLMKALNPGTRLPARFAVTRVEPGSLGSDNLQAYACVFLCNAVPLSGQGVLAAENYTRRGGTLVFFPGDRARPGDYASWRSLPAQPGDIREGSAEAPARSLRLAAPSDPLFTGLKVPPGAAPTIAVRRELTWTAPDAEATPLIVAGPEAPFLWSRPFGAGRVLFFSVSADRRWSTFPLSPLFLPLIHQIGLESAGLGRQRLFHWAARNLALSDVLPEFPGGAQLTGPDNQPVPLHASREEDRSVLYAENLRAPGVYSVARGAGMESEPALAINVDRQESDLRPVNARDLPALTGIQNLYVARDRDELMRRLDEYRRGRPLAEVFLWLALVFALLEVLLAGAMTRRMARRAAC